MVESEIVRIERSNTHRRVRHVVSEYQLQLQVNGRDLIVITCSPHQLNTLLIGFLRLQGLAASLDEILCCGTCPELGRAVVRIKKALPADWVPILTSACGGGTGLKLSRPTEEFQPQPSSYDSSLLADLMRQMDSGCKYYQRHGGLHAAAIGDENGLLLQAEDIGRHNCFDRLAGEAWLRQLELHGKILLTTGRISSEMALKAARLGIGVIASKTTPTDKAIAFCREVGMTLVGYLRGSSMEIFSHPQQLRQYMASSSIRGVTGVILAGGESRRMGSDKALLPIQGARFIDHVYRRISKLFEEVIIVTNSPELYRDLPCRKVTDIYQDQGALAGIHAGLKAASNEQVFVVGCDMPFVVPELVREICAHGSNVDLVLPHSQSGHEPLHALYGKDCLPAMEELLDTGKRRIILFFDKVRLLKLPFAEIARFDPQGISFRNINTPEDYYRLRGRLPARDESVSKLKRSPGK